MKIRLAIPTVTCSSRAHSVFIGAIAVLLASQSVQAANGIWLNTGVANANWTTGTNWASGTVPGATVAITGLNANADIATFNTALGTFGTSGSPILIDSASENIRGITFDTASVGSYFIGTTGGNSLYLSSAGTIQLTATAITATETINAPIVILGASGTYTFTNLSTSTGLLKFGGQISGGNAGATVLTLAGTNTGLNTISGNIVNGTATSLAITKSGAGTWVLSGTNTYTGATSVSAGTLSLTGSLTGSNVSTSSTGIVSQSSTGVIAGTNTTFTQGSSGISILAGTNTYTGATNVSAGTLSLIGSLTGSNVTTSSTGIVSQSSTGVIAGTSTTFTQGSTGTSVLAGTNGYTGATTINQGALNLTFGAVSTNILSGSSALVLGGGTLKLTGTGTQTLNGLTTTANTGSLILLSTNQTLTLGALTAANSNSALLFNNVAGGANATTSTIGTGIVTLSGQTAGTAINSGFTVLDAGGFGLATVDGSNQVVRLTATTLLPASDAVSTVDYAIDNNAGGAAADGSSSLAVSVSGAAKSITVDTTTASGILALNSGIVLSNNIWNFGGGSNTYQITGGASGAGLTSLAGGNAINFNNYNTGAVTIASPIVANGTNAVNVNGSGILVFSGSNTYTGTTTITGGTLKLSGAGTLGAATSTLGAITNGGILDLGGTNQTIAAFSGTSNGKIQNNSGSGNSTLTIGGNITSTFAGVIGDNNGINTGGKVAILQNGTSSTTLSGPNTYSGGTTLSAGGTLLSGTAGTYAGNALISGGLGTGPLTLNGGTFGSVNANVGNATTVNGDIAIQGSNRLEISGPWNMGGATRTLTLARGNLFSATNSSTLALQLNTQTNGPQVSVASGAMRLVADAAVAGTSYTGVKFFGNTNFINNAGLTIGNRVVVFSNNNDIFGGTSGSNVAALTMESGGYLSMSNESFTTPRNETVFSLSGSGGTVANLSTAAGTSTLTVNGTANTTFSGSIVNGSTLGSAASGGNNTFSGIAVVGVMALTKNGTGTQILAGPNNYTGITTVTAGTLDFAKQQALYNSAAASWTTTNISVASGAILALGVGDSASGYFDSTALDTFRNASHLGASTATVGFKSGAVLGIDTTNATGGTFTYSSVISNFGTSLTDGIAKLGTGTLILGSANTYTGVTTISGGVLSAGTLANGGTASSIGQAPLAAINLVLNNGTLQYTGGTVSVDRGMTINNTNGGTIEVFNSGTNLGTTGTVLSSANAAATLTKTGAGTLTLAGAADNAYLAATVNAGTLVLAKTSTSSVHAVGTGLTIGANGTAQLGGSGNDQIFDNTSSFVTVNGGIFDINTRPETVGNVTLNGGSITGTTGILTASTGSSFAMMSGSVSAILGGSGIALTKTTTGTVTLSGANTYTGTTAVNGGTLKVTHASGLGTTAGGTSVAANGVLDLQAAVLAEAITLNGTGISNGGALINSSNTVTGSHTGAITLGSASTITASGTGASNLSLNLAGGINNAGFLVTFDGANNTTVSGTKITGGGGLAKTGAGTLSLSAANDYTGATAIDAGKLVVTGSIGSSAVTVTGTGTILASGATGTIGSSVTVNADAILAAGGINTIGTATVGIGGTTLNSDSIFSWDLNVTTPGDTASATSYDNVLSSSLAGSDAIFKIVLGGSQTFSDNFWNFDHTWNNIISTNGTSGGALDLASVFSSFTYANVNGGALGTPDSLVEGAFTFTNGGSSLTWSAVPEPGSAIAGLLLAAGLLRRNRRND
ncbi:MAG: autotransporter-associated beta strand repeat-containing protein [Verrucomicrobiota bacterium]